MKKIFMFFFVLISFHPSISTLLAQSGWFWSNPMPQGNDLYSLQFVDNNTGFCVSNLSVLKTTNSGSNWEIKEMPLEYYLQGSFFLNSLTGYACGNGGLIIKTTDGAQSWQTLNSNINYDINYIYFKDLNTGFALGYYGSMLLFTSNGGSNWSVKINNPNLNLNCINFPSFNTGYAGGGSSSRLGADILKTTNGGIIWDTLPKFRLTINSIKFLNDNTGYAGGAPQFPRPTGSVYKTTNSGQNWAIILPETLYTSIKQIFFTDLNTGFALASYSSNFFRTTNGGINWLLSHVQLSSYTPGSAMYFLNFQTGYIIGDDGKMLKTSSAGINWSHLSGDHWFYPTDIKFIDENTGFVSNGSIQRTSDGGLNWDTVYATTFDYEIFSTYIFNPDIIFACGRSNVIKSTNGGINWSTLNNTTGNVIYEIAFPDINTGYRIHKVGGTGKSTNGGYTWFSVGYKVPWPLDIFFINVNTGFVCGGNPYSDSAKVAKTTNGGLSWTGIFFPIESFYSVYFTDSLTGYLAGNHSSSGLYDAYILKTTNQGLNWTNTTFNGFNIYDIHFPSKDTGYACSSRGTILKTTNAGLSWDHYRTNTNNWLESIYFPNNLTGYATGGLSSVIKTTNGGSGIWIGIEPISTKIPEKFYLYQNYPNPFNPITKIKFEIPSSINQNTKLLVYDILGRHVVTLIDEVLKPGIYEVEFNGMDLSSGVYFYKMIAGEYTESKKMVLLK